MHKYPDIWKSTILIVDDDPLNLKIVNSIIKEDGFDTISAVNGKDCLKKVKADIPDLILLDINMPGMNGIDVCRVLRENKQFVDLPIIFITADTDDNTLKKAFDAGGTDYICKPVKKIELTIRVRTALIQNLLLKKTIEEHKVKAILEMTGAVCHEMNQPLQVMMGYSQILALDLKENFKHGKMINNIIQQIERMAQITTNLMNITRYQTKQYVGNRNIVDISKAAMPG